jgi:CRP-like cAMP-binding protein
MSQRFPTLSPHPLEQRSSPRVAIWLPGRLKLSGPGWVGCHLRDIGSGGACIQTPSPIGLSDIRWLEIQLPAATLKVSVEGKWQREAGPEQAILTGVAFDGLDPEDERQIDRFVHERLEGLVNFIRRCPDLADLSLDEAMDMALVSRHRTATAGRYLLRAGEQGSDDSVYVLFEGSVGLEADVHGLRFPVARVGAGGVFGGISLLSPTVKSHLSAVANSDLVLLEVDRSSCEYLRRAKPLLAARIDSVIVGRHVSQLHDCIQRVIERLS